MRFPPLLVAATVPLLATAVQAIAYEGSRPVNLGNAIAARYSNSTGNHEGTGSGGHGSGGQGSGGHGSDGQGGGGRGSGGHGSGGQGSGGPHSGGGYNDPGHHGGGYNDPGHNGGGQGGGGEGYSGHGSGSRGNDSGIWHTQTVPAYVTLVPDPTEFKPHSGVNKTYSAT